MKKRKKKKGSYPGMAAVFALDGKTGKMDSFMRFDADPLPPIIRPDRPDEPRDFVPPTPGPKKRKPKS